MIAKHNNHWLFITLCIGVSMLAETYLSASDHTVPGYTVTENYAWTRGCAPTAAATVFSYYDNYYVGYGGLITWYLIEHDTFTGNYNNVPKTLDWLATEMGTGANGSTSTGNIHSGIMNVANNYCGYCFTSQQITSGGFGLNLNDWCWGTITQEINAGRPFPWTVVESSWVILPSDGHTMAAVGYTDSKYVIVYDSNTSGLGVQYYYYSQYPYNPTAWIFATEVDTVVPACRFSTDLNLTSLKNGGTIYAGQSTSIQWYQLGDSSITAVDIYYSTDSGNTWSYAAQNVSSSAGPRSYNWTVPSALGSHYRLCIIGKNSGGTVKAGDGSFSDFTVQQPSDTTPPAISVFNVSPPTTTLGLGFTISYTVSDTGGSGLKQVALWRANINGSATDSSWIQVGGAVALSGNGPYSSTFSDAPAAAGNYWYGIHVVDNANNYMDERIAGLGPLQRTVSQITTPAMTSPTPGSVLTSSSVTFQWSSGTGVNNYYLSVGNSSGATDIYGQYLGLNLSTTVNNLPIDGRTLYVRFYWLTDAAGWQSVDYSYTAYTLPIDTTPPTVLINHPTGGQTFTALPITVDGTANDPGSPSTGVSLVQVQVNGTSGTWQTASGTTSWSASVSLISGANTIYVRSQDGAGHYSSIASVNVTYNPPTQYTINASAGSGGTISPSGSFARNAGDNQSFTASPNANYVVNQWTVDGGMVQTGGTSYTLSNIQAGHNVQVTFTINILFPGIVIAWGDNSLGQRNIPFDLTNVVAIAAAASHSLALRAGGTVTAWGENYVGLTNVPVDLNNVVAIAAGIYHNLALRSNGILITWGSSLDGETNFPPGLTNIIAISAGNGFSVALKGDGTVLAWGFGGNGETKVPTGLAGVISISTYYSHTLSLKRDGTVVAWGWNAYGQTNVPMGLTNVIAVAAGGAHSLALTAGGTVTAWGYNHYGQTNVPTGLTNVIAIAAGHNISLALKADGTIIEWGYNGDGETNVPAGLTNVVAIAGGDAHSLALIGRPSQASAETLLSPVLNGNTFHAAFPTTRGRSYILEFKNSLQDTNWNMLPPVPGDDTLKNLTDPAAIGPQRFYRIRMQ